MQFLHSPLCHFSSPLPLFIFFFLSTFSLFSYRPFALPASRWQIANCTLHKGFTCTTTTLLTVLIESEGKTLSSHWILVAGRITKPFPTDLTGSQKSEKRTQRTELSSSSLFHSEVNLFCSQICFLTWFFVTNWAAFLHIVCWSVKDHYTSAGYYTRR